MKDEKPISEVMEDHVLVALTTMKLGGLKTFGQTLTSIEEAQRTKIWASALMRRNIKVEVIGLAAERLIGNSREFPTAGEFANACWEMQCELYEWVSLTTSGPVEMIEVPRSMATADVALLIEREAARRGIVRALPEPTARETKAPNIKEVSRAMTAYREPTEQEKRDTEARVQQQIEDMKAGKI